MISRLRGLSPLARGNLGAVLGQRKGYGPIPARAGEPGWSARAPFLNTAYPRSRGGTVSKPNQIAHHLGLSPLARGNRDQKATLD